MKTLGVYALPVWNQLALYILRGISLPEVSRRETVLMITFAWERTRTVTEWLALAFQMRGPGCDPPAPSQCNKIKKECQEEQSKCFSRFLMEQLMISSILLQVSQHPRVDVRRRCVHSRAVSMTGALSFVACSCLCSASRSRAEFPASLRVLVCRYRALLVR